MNKIKATKKDMRTNYYIISVGYCKLQNLLRHEEPIAFSVGQYGWDCDYYEIDGVIISTGYRPIMSQRTSTDFDMNLDYDSKAEMIIHNGSDYLQTKNALRTLLVDFVNRAKYNYERGL
jgi:hypothetical protein